MSEFRGVQIRIFAVLGFGLWFIVVVVSIIVGVRRWKVKVLCVCVSVCETGVSCEVVGPCASRPCHPSSRCTQDGDNYTCHCLDGKFIIC